MQLAFNFDMQFEQHEQFSELVLLKHMGHPKFRNPDDTTYKGIPISVRREQILEKHGVFPSTKSRSPASLRVVKGSKY